MNSYYTSFVSCYLHKNLPGLPWAFRRFDFAMVCLFALAIPLWSQKLLFSPGETLGVQVNDRQNNRWRTSCLDVTEKITSDQLFETAGDFFQTQYGKPFRFQTDLIREFGLKVSGAYVVKEGALQFKTGPKGWSLSLGAEPEDRTTSAIRLISGWGKEDSNAYRLEMEVEQDVPNTAWTLWKSQLNAKSWSRMKSFRVQGKSPQKVVSKLGWVCHPSLHAVCGMRLECLTPGATVKIRSLRIVPYSGNAYWRGDCQLPFEPVMAKLSWIHKTGNYDIYINGKRIGQGQHHARHAVETFDVLNHIRKGRNVIAIRDQFYGGLLQNSQLIVEGVIVGKNGEICRILGDSNWRWSFTAPREWEQPDFKAEGWKVPRLSTAGLSSMWNGKPVSSGFDPDHMGPLDIRPASTPYPMFDYDGDVAFRVRIPSGIPQPELRLDIRDADTGKTLETVTATGGKVQGNFRDFLIKPRLRRTGAYRTYWTLRTKGQVLDACRDEMVIVGPIPQDQFALKDFETELEKRLQLVQKIDCTNPNPPATTFLDHSGSGNHPTLNVGKVVTRNGMSYRETGPGYFDYFCYKLNIPKLGDPMIAEVIVPDDADRYIHSCVAESFPVTFENNGFGRTWPNASGCTSTGDFYPLSKGRKALRYVFFPGSYNSTIMVQNGRVGLPAAACEINIYSVKGGLPALKLPETNRIYANHNERIVFNNWSCYGDPVAQGMNYHMNNYDGAWINAYRAIARKIQWLRFQGHNASVEGAFMYQDGPFSSKHARSILNNDRFDYYYAVLKMYRHNHIRQLVGFEYMRSMCLGPEGAYDVSDDQVRNQGKRTAYTIDRHGRQSIGYMGMGLNFMNPQVWKSLTDLLKELYARYDGVGDVAGLFTVNGGWWLPGFTTNPGVDASQVGYDDDSVEAFEKDTGINLGLPRLGAERFPKRYQLLTGKYATQWFAWRGRKMREKLEEMQRIVSGGKQKWKLFAMPLKRKLSMNPFSTNLASPASRDAYAATLQREAGFPQELYGRKDGIVLVASMNTAKRLENSRELQNYGMCTNQGTRKLYRQNDSVYLTCDGLNENIGTYATGAKEWWFRNNATTVYDRKPIGDFAYADMIHVVADRVPRYMFHTWIDVNVTTAHGDQARRFLKAFYSVPEGEFVKAKAISGIEARVWEKHLVLVNDSPYPLTGKLACKGVIRDLVYDRDGKGGMALTVRPYTMLVFKTEHAAQDVRGGFTFQPKTESEIRLLARNIFQEKPLLEKIPQDRLTSIRRELDSGSAYSLLRELNDFEVLAHTERFFGSLEQMKNQKRLLKELETKGVVRINCGYSKDYVDGDGNLWLPDQNYTGYGAYGNEFTIPVDRGTNLTIHGTKAPRVYQTEVYGSQMFYHFPLPDGTYTVRLHCAETYSANKGCGRIIQVTVGDKTREFNPVVLGGGFCRPAITEWGPMTLTDNILTIKGTKDAEFNGIEIVRKKQTAKTTSLDSAQSKRQPMLMVKPEQTMSLTKNRKTFGTTQMSGYGGTIRQEGALTYLSLGRDSMLYANALDMSKSKPDSQRRTLTMVVRASGQHGLFSVSDGPYRFDVRIKDGTVRPAILGFPPQKGWFSIGLPAKDNLRKQTWHHIAMTVDPAGEGQIFVDGVLATMGSLEKLRGLELPEPHAKFCSGIWGKNHAEDMRVDILHLAYYDTLLSSPDIKAEATKWLLKLK